MGELINYTIKEFMHQDNNLILEYMAYLILLRPVQTKQEVFYMTLKEVQDIRDLVTVGTLNSLIEVIALVQKKKLPEVLKMTIMDFFPLINSVTKQLEQIAHAEQIKLVSKHVNTKWEAVNGSERLSEFGIYNLLNRLTNGDITKWETALKLTYADVFLKLAMDTVKSDLDHEMENIKKPN